MSPWARSGPCDISLTPLNMSNTLSCNTSGWYHNQRRDDWGNSPRHQLHGERGGNSRSHSCLTRAVASCCYAPALEPGWVALSSFCPLSGRKMLLHVVRLEVNLQNNQPSCSQQDNLQIAVNKGTEFVSYCYRVKFWPWKSMIKLLLTFMSWNSYLPKQPSFVCIAPSTKRPRLMRGTSRHNYNRNK